MKRIRSFGLVLLIVLSQFFNSATYVFAEPEGSSQNNLITISNNLRNLESNFENYIGELGIYSEMYCSRQLVEYAMWLRLLLQLNETGIYSNNELNRGIIYDSLIQYNNMLEELSELNKSNTIRTYVVHYHSIGITKNMLDDTSKHIEKYKDSDDVDDYNNVVKDLELFKTKFYKIIKGYFKELPNDVEENNQNFGVYKNIASECFKSSEFIEIANQNIQDIVNNIKVETNEDVNADWSDTYAEKFSKFSEIFQYWYFIGSANAYADSVSNLIEYNPELSYLENIGDIHETNKGVVTVGADPKLSLLYLACFASSATYTPFHSYTGDTTFTQALSSIPESTDIAAAALKFYNNIKTLKKPIYFRELDSNGDPTGSATLLSINEFISKIKNGKDGCYVTIQGDLYHDIESDSWVYTNEYRDAAVNESILSEADQVNTENQENDLNGFTDPLVTEEDSKNIEINLRECISASNIITAEGRMNEPILMMGTSYERDIDNSTTAILTNIINQFEDLTDIDNPDTEYLYINMFGDIVDKDDLVILPAAANPLYYKTTEYYYPYTVAFMNSYPTILNGSEDLIISGVQNLNKYIFMLYNENISDLDTDIAAFNAGTACLHTKAMKIKDYRSLDLNSKINTVGFANQFLYNIEDSIIALTSKRHIIGSVDDWEEDNNMYKFSIINPVSSLTYNGTNVFPYDEYQDSDHSISSIIATGLYMYLTKDGDENRDLELLNNNYIIHNIAISGYEGTTAVANLLNALAVSYDTYMNNSSERMLTTVENISYYILNVTQNISSVLGINSFYEDKITGTVSNYLIQYWLFVLVILLFVSIIIVLRYQFSVIKSLTTIIGTVIFSIVFVLFVPVYGQFWYNLLTNDISNAYTARIVGTLAEEQIGETPEFDSMGSLTVYRYPIMQLNEIYDGFGIESSDVSAGNYFVLDRASGFYVEGDCLKYDISTLFSNISIRSNRIGSENAVSLYREVNDNVDYYTPYVSIMNGFVNKLNLFANTYSIPQSIKTYKTSQSRPKYLVYDYVNSDVFTKGVYGIKPLKETMGMSEEDLLLYEENQKVLVDRLNKNFGKNTDWLGLTDILTKDAISQGSVYQTTLWFEAMAKKGIYTASKDEDGLNIVYSYDDDEMAKLIYYVNLHTRDYIYDIEESINSYSDDTLIKLICLKAAFVFDQYLSQASNYVYPVAFNNSEYSLGSVFTMTFVDDYSSYVRNKYDLVNYLSEEGVFALILLDITSILLYILIFINRFVLLAGYYLFGIIILFRMLSNKPLDKTIYGFLKASGICIIGSLSTVLIIFFTSNAKTTISKALILSGVSLVLVSVYSFVIRAVLSDLSNFGNSKFKLQLQGINSKTKHLFKGTLSEEKNDRSDYTPLNLNSYSAYKNDSNIEDIYSNTYNPYGYEDNPYFDDDNDIE